MADLLFRFLGDVKQLRSEVSRMRQDVTRDVRATVSEVNQAGAAGGNAPGAVSSAFDRLRSLFASIRQSVGGYAAEGEAAAAVTQKLGQSAGAAAPAFSGMAGAAGVAVGVLGATAAAAIAAEAAILRMSLQVAQTLGPLDRLADRTGVSESNLLRFKLAGDVVGVTFETIVEQIEFFNRNLATAAADPTGKLSAQFKKLGIDATQAINAPNQALETVSARIGQIQNPVQRLASTTALFGEEGRKLVGVFRELSVNASQYREVIERLGGAEGVRRTVQASAELTRELGKLQQQFQILQILIARDVIPALIVSIKSVGPVIRDLAPVITVVGSVAANILLAVTAQIRAGSKALRELIDAGAAASRGELTGAAARLVKILTISATDEFLRLKEEIKAVGISTDDTTAKFQGLTTNTKSAADAAANRLRALENVIRDAERAYDRETDSLKRNFELRSIAEDDYTRGLVQAAQERLRIINQTLDQENAAVSSGFQGTERQNKLDEILRRRNEGQLVFETELEKINFDSSQRRLRLSRELVEAQTAAELEGLKRQAAAIQAALNDRFISFESAQTRLTEIAAREIEIRIGLAQGEVDQAGANATEREAALTRLRDLEAEYSSVQAEGVRLRAQARQRDLEANRRYSNELAAIQAEALRLRIDTLSTFANSGAEVATQRAAIERAAAVRQFEEIRLRLEAEERANARDISDDFETQQAKLENRRRINELILEEARRLRAELENIDRQERVDSEENTPGSLRVEFGTEAADAIQALEEALGRPLTTLERLRLLLSQNADELRRNLPSAAGLARASLVGFAQAAAASFAQYLQGANSLRGVAGALTAALLAPWIEYAKNKAQQAFLESAEAFLRLDFVSGAKWAAIGAGWTILAAAGGAVANAAAGSGSGGGGVASARGTTASDQARATEDRIRFFDNTRDRNVTTVIVKHETGMFVEKVEGAIAASYEQAGVVRRIVDNSNDGRPINT